MRRARTRARAHVHNNYVGVAALQAQLVQSSKMLCTLLLTCIVWTVQAQPPPPQPTDCTQCPTSEPFMMVEITQDDTYRYVKTDTCPPYDNPGWNNPNDACQFDKIFKIPLYPKYALTPIPVGEEASEYEGLIYLKPDPVPVFGSLGVLVNGVEVYGVGSPCRPIAPCPSDGAPTDYVDAVDAEGHAVDSCAGHASPSGSYHIHSGLGFNTTAKRENCRLPVDTDGEHSQLLGWMFDGFGLYGRYSLNGVVPTDLDKCSGHIHELDGEMTYHYHLPDEFPWTIGCFKGCPEASNNEMELMTLVSNPDYGCSEVIDPGSGATESTNGAKVGMSDFISVCLFMCMAIIMKM